MALPARAGGVPPEGVLFCEEITTIDRDFLRCGPLGPSVEEQMLSYAAVRCRFAVRRASAAAASTRPAPA